MRVLGAAIPSFMCSVVILTASGGALGVVVPFAVLAAMAGTSFDSDCAGFLCAKVLDALVVAACTALALVEVLISEEGYEDAWFSMTRSAQDVHKGIRIGALLLLAIWSLTLLLASFLLWGYMQPLRKPSKPQTYRQDPEVRLARDGKPLTLGERPKKDAAVGQKTSGRKALPNTSPLGQGPPTDVRDQPKEALHPEACCAADAPATPDAGDDATETLDPWELEEMFDLQFQTASYDNTHHEAFKERLTLGLTKLGADEATMKRVRITLREGGIIARISGPASAVGLLQGLPLERLAVFGHMCKRVGEFEREPNTAEGILELSESNPLPQKHEMQRTILQLGKGHTAKQVMSMHEHEMKRILKVYNSI